MKRPTSKERREPGRIVEGPRLVFGERNGSGARSLTKLREASGGFRAPPLPGALPDLGIQGIFPEIWLPGNSPEIGFPWHQEIGPAPVRALIQKPLRFGQGSSVGFRGLWSVSFGFRPGCLFPWAYFTVCVSVAVLLPTEYPL